MVKNNHLPLLPRNRSGWIEIAEAFVAVLLVAAVLLVIINRGYTERADISERVYEAQISILREIQTNDTLRADILTAPTPLPVEWEYPTFPVRVKDKIVERTPNYLDCVGKICYMNQTCSLGAVQGKDVYSLAVTIVSTLEGVDFRKLNLFCWTS